jgi:beta-glucosidase
MAFSFNVLLDVALTTSEALAKESPEPDLEEHHQFVLKMAEEAVVLLENNGILPLKKENRVGFIGKFAEEPRYQGAGSSQVNAFRVDKILEHKDDYKFDYQGNTLYKFRPDVTFFLN